MILIFETSPSNAVTTGGPLQGIPPRAARVALLFPRSKNSVQYGKHYKRHLQYTYYTYTFDISWYIISLYFFHFLQNCTFIDFRSSANVLKIVTHALICLQW